MLNGRESAWQRLCEIGTFDVLVAGGGVTGAAIAFEAARRGLRVALAERNDFASGTSSRSSKLIHGGLRYLKEGRVGLTRESVRERQALLREAPGLVDRIDFLMPHYRGRKPRRTTMAFGLALYDALAGSWNHRFASAGETLELVPQLDPDGLQGAHRYIDATTDDARLVLRLLSQACDCGATAINYTGAELTSDANGVCGARLRDLHEQRTVEVRAKAVISATGAFADALREQVGAAARLRALRGSHLVIAAWRLPLAFAVAFEHPGDRRPVFAYPWQGATLAGTTDLDHDAALDAEPHISPAEVSYLLSALQSLFPSASLTRDDIVATFAGVRPIVDARRDEAPSKASRDHVVWSEGGLITVTGGKLTTFRPMALDALAAAAPRLPAFDLQPQAVFAPSGTTRWDGVYGSDAQRVRRESAEADLEPVGPTPFTWADLRWAARNEMIVHLDDLLLRRTRIGLLLQNGAQTQLERLERTCRAELGWSDERWQAECDRYRRLTRASYSIDA